MRFHLITAIFALFLPLIAGAQTHGIDASSIDTSVKPADDFYGYVNNRWIAKATIPKDQPGIDAFYEVQMRAESEIRDIVDRIAARDDWKQGSIEAKIARFYSVYANDALAEKQGITPIKGLLDLCAQSKDRSRLLHVVAQLDLAGASGLFGGQILSDFHNSNRRMLYLSQPELSLPDRDYYLKGDTQSKFIREAYLGHMKKIFELSGDSIEEASLEAKTVLELETKLATMSRSTLALRDLNAQYNPMPYSAFAKKYPKLAWVEFAREEGLGDPGIMSVAMPEYFEGLYKLLEKTPAQQLRPYLRWCVLNRYAGVLTKAFRDEQFRFQALFSGQQEQSASWRRYLNATQAVFGEPLGRLYVKQVFSPQAKKRATQLVLGLREAFANRIKTNDWMSSKTKNEALRKLMAISIKVGYPDSWHSYDNLVVGTDSRVANAIRASQFAHDRATADFHKPVDHSEWGMTPQTVNAYYNPMNNEIVFPAAILQPPFFDPQADDASNYGAIGMVIGHEMTHGFDDQGRIFDAKGNLRDWWTKADDKGFTAKKQVLIHQYDAYTAVGKTKVSGSLTIGENIADLGGIHIAYDALGLAQKKNPSGPVDGFTPQQRFFLAFGQIWRFKSTTQYAELLAKLDPHSPSPVRVLGTLVNVPEFIDAFGSPSQTGVGKPGSGTLKIW